MSLLRKFQDLNNFIYNENYYKLIFGKTQIGYVHRKIAKYILLNVKGIYLLEQKIYFENISQTKLKKVILKITETLSEKKKLFIPADELFSCRNTIEGKELFKLDRKLVEFLGIRGYGVHLIIYIKRKNSYKLWGGAHRDIDKTIENVKQSLVKNLKELNSGKHTNLLSLRRKKYLKYGSRFRV